MYIYIYTYDVNLEYLHNIWYCGFNTRGERTEHKKPSQYCRLGSIICPTWLAKVYSLAKFSLKAQTKLASV